MLVLHRILSESFEVNLAEFIRNLVKKTAVPDFENESNAAYMCLCEGKINRIRRKSLARLEKSVDALEHVCSLDEPEDLRDMPHSENLIGFRLGIRGIA